MLAKIPENCFFIFSDSVMLVVQKSTIILSLFSVEGSNSLKGYMMHNGMRWRRNSDQFKKCVAALPFIWMGAGRLRSGSGDRIGLCKKKKKMQQKVEQVFRCVSKSVPPRMMFPSCYNCVFHSTN